MKEHELLRVAVVIQRYGREIIGGAEIHARMLVERLNSHPDVQIEVFTSCAKNHMTWANDYSSGLDPHEQIPVHRFKTVRTRSKFLGLYLRLLQCVPKFLKPARRFLEKRWIEAQGPFVPDLISHLKSRQGEFHCCLAFTYLYYPTLACISGLDIPTVLIPMAHDEAPWYFVETGESLSKTRAILANSAAELRFIQQTRPEIAHKMSVAGIGIDVNANRNPSVPKKSGQDFKLLYLGRIGKGKAVHELLYYFSQQTQTRRVILHLAGPIENGFALPQDNENIIYHGRITDEEKNSLLSEVDCIVNPSHHESMSILVLEAISSGKPVLAQAQCEIFQDYAKEYDTIYLFSDKNSWNHQLIKIQNELPDLESKLTTNADKLRRKYQWSRIERSVISQLQRLN